MSARLLRDGQIVFAGVGIPLLAATLAQRLQRAGPDHPVRGRHHRRLCRARQIAAFDQRAALHQARQYGAGQHRRAAAAAARLCRCRLHGRRADRPVRQSEQLVHRRCRAAGDAAARHRRRQRHRQPDPDDRGDEARKAPLCRTGRFCHQPRVSPGGDSRRAGRARRRRHVSGRDRSRRSSVSTSVVEADDPAGAAPRRHGRAGRRKTPASRCRSPTIFRSPSRRPKTSSRYCATSTPTASTPPDQLPIER